MIVDPEKLNYNINLGVQVNKLVEAAMALGRLSLEDATAVWQEWCVQTPIDTTIADQASMYIYNRRTG
jgi:hypothetical protein